MSDTDLVLQDARRALNNSIARRSIGTKSKALKRAHFWKKTGMVFGAAGAILVGAGITGAIIDGIGTNGVLLTGLAIAGSTALFTFFPRMKMPTAETLKKENLDVLAGKTEIWLENQRPALPAPAVHVLDDLGRSLDALAPQLQNLGDGDQAAHEVRSLLGEHLPNLINNYQSVPARLRKEKRDGLNSPEEQLVEGLRLIDKEIDSASRQLAEGNMDNLAITSRFLELKYQEQ